VKKLTIAVAAMFVVSLASVAYAQEQRNTYDLSASTSPTRAGSKSRPVPVSIRFAFTVNEASGLRPGVVETYRIRFNGLRVNTRGFATCSLSRMNQDNSIDRCPRGSIVGTGFIENATGGSNDKSDTSIQCNAQLWVVNSGRNRGAIFVKGSQASTNPRTRCAVDLGAPIPVRFANTSSATTLTFTVPHSLRHPLGTFDNAVKRVTATIRRVTRRGRGFYEAVGGCRNNRRQVSVTFTQESGQVGTARTNARCRR
jgi:hypothetical protein